MRRYILLVKILEGKYMLETIALLSSEDTLPGQLETLGKQQTVKATRRQHAQEGRETE